MARIADLLLQQKADLELRRNDALAEIESITRGVEFAGRDRLTADEDQVFEARSIEIKSLDANIDSIDKRIAELGVEEQRFYLAKSRMTRAGARTGTSEVRGQALDLLTRSPHMAPQRAEALVRAIEAERSDDLAARVNVLGDPAYLSAFLKVAKSDRGFIHWTEAEKQAVARVESECRATLALGNTGSYMVPTALDPAVLITGTGSIVPPMSVLADQRLSAVGTWKGVTAGQISASWTAEGTESTDVTPALAQPEVVMHTWRVMGSATWEMIDDNANLLEDIMSMFNDARLNLLAESDINGTGSGQPFGAVATLSATTASRVAPATGGAFVLGDVYKLQAALAPRYQGNARWLGSLPVLQAIRRFNEGSTGNASFWTQLGAGMPSELLGREVYEASPMSSTITTGNAILTYADFKRFLKVDHVGGTRVEFLSNLYSTANPGLPVGKRGWVMWGRSGSAWADVSAGRVLVL